MNPQATELNDIIRKNNPSLYAMLSARGREIFFPKLGILSQSAAARGKRLNATIGEAREDDGSPMALQALSSRISQNKTQAFPYSPSPGNPDIRKKWQQLLLQKNPGLQGKSFSLPVSTCGITHALSISAYLFSDQDSEVVVPNLYWENYDLIFQNWFQAPVKFYNLFQGQGLDIAALEKSVSGKGRTLCLVLNFPNNPSGYTPTRQEADQICSLLLSSAQAGNRLTVLLDDAYFGLVYEKDIIEESLFSRLSDLHENILAVKMDGPTKEDYVWGFRVGFLTFGIKGGNEELYSALEAKAAGAIRGNISNISSLSQNLLLEAYETEDYSSQKAEKYQTLKTRYLAVKNTLDSHPEYAEYFKALPFNSGYFMCVSITPGINSEMVWKVLLEEYDTGVIHLNGLLRVAFSSLNTSLIPVLFANMYEAVKKVVKIQ